MVGRDGSMADLMVARATNPGDTQRSPKAESNGLGGHYGPQLREVLPSGERSSKSTSL